MSSGSYKSQSLFLPKNLKQTPPSLAIQLNALQGIITVALNQFDWVLSIQRGSQEKLHFCDLISKAIHPNMPTGHIDSFPLLSPQWRSKNELYQLLGTAGWL